MPYNFFLLLLNLFAFAQTNVPIASNPQGKVLHIVVPVAIAPTFESTFKQLVADFNQSHPNTHIEPIFTAESFESLKKIISLDYAGSKPDLALINEADLPFLNKKGYIQKIPKKLFDETRFISNLTATNTCSAKAPCSLPFIRRTQSIYFNKELLFKLGLNPELIPTSWNELSLYSQKFHSPSFSGIAIANSGNTAIAGWHVLGLPRLTGKLDPVLNWIEFMQSHPASLAQGDLRTQDIITQFMDQKAVVILSTLDRQPFFKSKAPFKFGMLLPEGKERVWFGLDLVALTKSALEKEALQFVEYLYKPENALKVFESTYTIPVSQLYLKDPAWSKKIQEFPELKKLTQPNKISRLVSMNHYHIPAQHRADFVHIVWNAILTKKPRKEVLKDLQKLLSTDSQ